MPSKFVIKEAIKMAENSNEEFRLGAVLYKGGSVISSAFNSNKMIGYRKSIFEFDPTRHAEVAVIHNVSREVIKECGLLVVRIDRNGILVSAKPCKACMQAVKSSGISKLYYSNYEGDIIRINPNKVDISNWNKEILCRESLLI